MDSYKNLLSLIPTQEMRQNLERIDFSEHQIADLIVRSPLSLYEKIDLLKSRPGWEAEEDRDEIEYAIEYLGGSNYDGRYIVYPIEYDQSTFSEKWGDPFECVNFRELEEKLNKLTNWRNYRKDYRWFRVCIPDDEDEINSDYLYTFDFLESEPIYFQSYDREGIGSRYSSLLFTGLPSDEQLYSGNIIEFDCYPYFKKKKGMVFSSIEYGKRYWEVLFRHTNGDWDTFPFDEKCYYFIDDLDYLIGRNISPSYRGKDSDTIGIDEEQLFSTLSRIINGDDSKCSIASYYILCNGIDKDALVKLQKLFSSKVDFSRYEIAAQIVLDGYCFNYGSDKTMVGDSVHNVVLKNFKPFENTFSQPKGDINKAKVETFFKKQIRSYTFKTKLPKVDIATLENNVNERSKENTRESKMYDYGYGLPLISIQYMLDMLYLLGDSTEVYCSDDLLAPLFLTSECGCGILMPIRKH